MSTLATKVEQFIKLRDYKKAAKKEFDKSMERINQAVAKLDAEILDELQTQGLKNVKTDVGTAYIVTQSSATVKDREAFAEWCEQTDNRGAMDIRANKAAVRELLNEGVTVPGVKFSEQSTIGVRRS